MLGRLHGSQFQHIWISKWIEPRNVCSVTKAPQSSALPEANSSPLAPKALGEAVASSSTTGATSSNAIVDDNQLAQEFSVSLIRAAGVFG